MIREPKEIQIELPNGTELTYTLSLFDCVEGREIISKYPMSAVPKIGDYAVNEEMMLKIIKHVYVDLGGKKQALSTKDLIRSHVPSWEVLMKLEIKMMEYNCSFFQDGRVSTFLADIAQRLPQWITKILTDSLGSLSRKEKPPSTNSEPSTH